MQGTVINYRGSHKTQHPNQMIISISGVNDKARALELIGKKVIWTSPAKKEIKGSIKKSAGWHFFNLYPKQRYDGEPYLARVF